MGAFLLTLSSLSCFYAVCTWVPNSINPSPYLRDVIPEYLVITSQKDFVNVWSLPAKETLSMFGRYQQKIRVQECLIHPWILLQSSNCTGCADPWALCCHWKLGYLGTSVPCDTVAEWPENKKHNLVSQISALFNIQLFTDIQTVFYPFP